MMFGSFKWVTLRCSPMAFLAICLVLHVKGSFTVVAQAAEHAFVDLAHVHLISVGVLLHLERAVVTGAAPPMLSFNMLFMAEEY